MKMIISANAIEEIKNTTATMSAEEINDYIRVINDPHYYKCDYAIGGTQASDSIDRVLSELMTCSYPDEALPCNYDWEDMDESERAEWCKEQGIEQDGTEYGKWVDYCRNECGKYLDELSELLKNIREQRKKEELNDICREVLDAAGKNDLTVEDAKKQGDIRLYIGPHNQKYVLYFDWKKKFDEHEMIEVRHQGGVRHWTCADFVAAAMEDGWHYEEFDTLEQAEEAYAGDPIPSELQKGLESGPVVLVRRESSEDYKVIPKEKFKADEEALDYLGDDFQNLIVVDTLEDAMQIYEHYTGHEYGKVQSVANEIIFKHAEYEIIEDDLLSPEVLSVANEKKFQYVEWKFLEDDLGDIKMSEDPDKDLLSPKMSIEPVSLKKETGDSPKMKL